MYIFGFNIPVEELLIIFAIVVAFYLVLLELEFRQIRKMISELSLTSKELNKTSQALKKIVKKNIKK